MRPRVRFGSYLQRDSLLDPETRELAIMRTAWNINAAYEWAHHVEAAKSAGLSDDEIARIAQRPIRSRLDRKAARRASGRRRSPPRGIRQRRDMERRSRNYYDMKERIEIVYTVGGYTMTGLAINSFGVQIEPGYPAMPR